MGLGMDQLSLSLGSRRYGGTPTPSPTDPLALLTAPQVTYRNAVLAEYANDWSPDPDAVSWDDTVVISDCVTLNNWLNGTAVGGITRNVARNQRVRLAAAWTNNLAQVFRFRGLDYFAAGKILLVETETTQVDLKTEFSMLGARGIYVRNLRFSQSVTDRGGQAEWTPGVNAYTVTNTGSGYAVNDLLTTSTSPASAYISAILRVTSVDGSGGITGLAVEGADYGVFSGNTTGVALSGGAGTGAIITVTIGVNPRDSTIITIGKSASFPLFPLLIFDNLDVGAGWATSLPNEWLSCFGIGTSEQVTVKNCRFRGFQTALRVNTCRRFKRDGCDFQLNIGDEMIVTNTTATATNAGMAFNAVWPDAIAYSYSRKCTGRNSHDDVNATTPGGRLMGLFLEHTDAGQAGTSGDTGNIHRLDEFDCFYLERQSYRDVKGGRLAGGTQGHYNDDTTLTINGLSFSCFIAPTASSALTGWTSQEYYAAYCTAVRTGSIAPNGGGTTLDVEVGFLSRKKTAGGTANHYVNNCVLGVSQTTSSGTSYYPGTLTNTALTIVPALGGPSAYAAAFPSLGATADAQGRMSYPWTDDGVETQAAFRARIWAAFAQSGAGIANPANWP